MSKAHRTGSAMYAHPSVEVIAYDVEDACRRWQGLKRQDEDRVFDMTTAQSVVVIGLIGEEYRRRDRPTVGGCCEAQAHTRLRLLRLNSYHCSLARLHDGLGLEHGNGLQEYDGKHVHCRLDSIEDVIERALRIGLAEAVFLQLELTMLDGRDGDEINA